MDAGDWLEAFLSEGVRVAYRFLINPSDSDPAVVLPDSRTASSRVTLLPGIQCLPAHCRKLGHFLQEPGRGGNL
jgi:hypothetical protein